MTDKMREAVARAIWNIRREEEDRCDMELEDIGADHSVWAEADAAIGAMREALVITLPNTECFGECSQEVARVMRDSCADAIEEQGIKFEVSE